MDAGYHLLRCLRYRATWFVSEHVDSRSSIITGWDDECQLSLPTSYKQAASPQLAKFRAVLFCLWGNSVDIGAGQCEDEVSKHLMIQSELRLGDWSRDVQWEDSYLVHGCTSN